MIKKLGLLSFIAVNSTTSAWAGYGGGGIGSKIGLLLITIAVGYWVLTLAQKQPKPLNTIGRILGSLICLVSILGIVCMLACGGRSCKLAGSKCGYAAKKAGCPYAASKCSGGPNCAVHAKTGAPTK